MISVQLQIRHVELLTIFSPGKRCTHSLSTVQHICTCTRNKLPLNQKGLEEKKALSPSAVLVLVITMSQSSTVSDTLRHTITSRWLSNTDPNDLNAEFANHL